MSRPESQSFLPSTERESAQTPLRESGRPREQKPDEPLADDIDFITPEVLAPPGPKEGPEVYAVRLTRARDRAVGSLNYLLDASAYYGPSALEMEEQPDFNFMPTEVWLEKNTTLRERYANMRADKETDRETWHQSLAHPITDIIEFLSIKLDEHNARAPHHDSVAVQTLEELLIEANAIDRADRSVYRTQHFGKNLSTIAIYREAFEGHLQGDYTAAEHANFFVEARPLLRHFLDDEDFKKLSQPEKDIMLDRMRDELARFAARLNDTFGADQVASGEALTPADIDDTVLPEYLRSTSIEKKVHAGLRLIVNAMRSDLEVTTPRKQWFPQFFPSGHLKNPPEVVELSRKLLVDLKKDIQENVHP